MSHVDADSSPPASFPSFSRDWFFPSPSPYCAHSAAAAAAAAAAKTPKYPRRFSTNPRPSSSSAASLDPKPPRPPSFRSAPPVSPPLPYREARYAGPRRRLGPSLRSERPRAGGEKKAVSSGGGAAPSAGADRKPEAPAEKVPSRCEGVGDLRRRLGLRWRMAFLVAIVLTAFSSVVHKNFSLRSQVEDLQGQISQLRITLQACSLLDLAEFEGSIDKQNQDGPNKRFKNIALISSLSILCIPILLFKCIDKVPRLRSSDCILEEVSLKKQLAYRLDVFFSVHPYAKPLALLVATLLLIFLGGLALFGVTDDDMADCLWLSWTYVASAGNHADSEGFGPRLVSLLISFGGMLIFAMMLGLVSDAISEKFDSLRKGRSEVVEQNHTLILGWSDKLGSLLNQLALANESLGGGTIVVMAERDKEEMELDIAKMEFDFSGTSVICRSGSPLILADLKKVSVSKARAIIVLAVDGNADQSDARALRTVLSLTGVKEGLRGHIVVELSDLDNEILVKLVGGDLVETVVAHDVIGRLMIQCARQPGLAQIWEDILGFENCEFYIKRWPQLDGMQFEDVLISFPDAIPCGIKVASCGGKIILNPDDSYVLQEGDEVLVIAEDDDTYAPTALPMVWRGHLPKEFSIDQSSEKILFCGWRRDMEDMIMVLDASLAPESELWMFNEVPEEEREQKLIDGGLEISRLANIKIENREGNAVIRRHLESLPLESFDSILILADESVEDSAIQADSRSLATLLLIRDIQAKRLPLSMAPSRRGNFSQSSWMGEMQQASDKSVIISEILDPRTKNLLSMSKISDYVLSNELVSMALAMVAEDRQINDVLEELFAEEGNELHIRPADLYLCEGEELSFYELLLRTRLRREIMIGYRLANAEKAVINPPAKDERRTWSVRDVFVVITDKE
ncbi:ion channel CASTOR isoform X1 [Eucalyptus grandis]|uniref:ion channel CASTOR isoform X1 n=1 Tax=Eucalyptus grandis TaxID=71139 RepID=UPI00192E8087|nr:ion channel CASTOR isoform X1 [Eucalyptus grandis]